MALRETISEILAKHAGSEEFGMHGPTAEKQIVEILEQELNVTLPEQVAEFIRDYGSMQFSPGRHLSFLTHPMIPGCKEWTEDVREEYPDIPPHWIVVHEDEIVYYLLDTHTGEVFAWESYAPPLPENFYRRFPDFKAFLRHLSGL